MTASWIANWPGKSSVEPGGLAHPAIYHMLDVAAVAERLLLPLNLSPARQALFAALVALHDLGKIGTEFRDMLQRGTKQEAGRHWHVTEAWLWEPANKEWLLQRLGGTVHDLDPLIGAIAGHHGRPSTRSSDDRANMRRLAGPEAAADARTALEALLALWPEARLDLGRGEAVTLSWLLAGLTTVADWVGSNTDWFPPQAPTLTAEAYLDLARLRAMAAVEAAGLDGAAVRESELFDFSLRPMQAAAETIELRDGPMLAILEDETGSGKTEAALILAQRMLRAGKGRGLFLALPTMATADAMFRRADGIVGAMLDSPSLTLAHGRSGLSVPYQDVRGRPAGGDGPTCAAWLADDRRRALLADVGVGTVDQALLAILPTRFSALRVWGLASKILIVDEVHDMGEPYVAQLLCTLLRLHARLGGSAILLTATLPLAWRAKLIRAFEEGAGRATDPDPDQGYPSLMVAGGASARDGASAPSPKGPVTVQRLATADEAADLIAGHAAQGAACVWVRNAVDDAIEAVDLLHRRGVAADLLHARFALCDRKRIEAEVVGRFGRDGHGREGRVVVATQVLEMSLDLDFDVMVSDLAPMAALVQRAGRLWRHMDLRPGATRPVPAPVLHVVSADPADVSNARWLHGTLGRGVWVYPLDTQWRTADVLFRAGAIDAPSGLRVLIEAVHGEEAADVPPALEKAEIDRIGGDHAAANLGQQNVVTLGKGYREGGGGHDDRHYPTRLGEVQQTLALARMEGGVLRPWARAAGPEAWLLSEVPVAARRLRDLPLPDQNDPAVRAAKSAWPAWKGETVTLCPVGADGMICPGLRYDARCGLVFVSPNSGDDP